jgi:hypothetical protein
MCQIAAIILMFRICGSIMKLPLISAVLTVAAFALAVPAHASFSSASGLPPGSSQSNPIYPSFSFWGSTSGVQSYNAQFAAPTADQWYSTTIETGGLWLYGIRSAQLFVFGSGSFTSITAPDGFGAMTLRVGSTVVDSDFTPGEVFSFASGIREVTLALNSPPVFPAGSSAANSFQFKVGVAGAPATLYLGMTGAAAVPETSTFALTLLGVLGLGVLTAGSRRKSR